MVCAILKVRFQLEDVTNKLACSLNTAGYHDGIYSNQNNSKLGLPKFFFNANMLWFILGQIVGQVVRKTQNIHLTLIGFITNFYIVLITNSNAGSWTN
jgi:hypothetical protein